MEKIKIKTTKIEYVLLILIILVAAFLRFYHIDGFMTFLGDEGRDVRIVRDLVTKGNLVFIGPQTSIGNMYLGPLYYYLIAPSLLLSGLNPIGPAMFNALIGVFTVYLVWRISKEWFGAKTALVSSILYAISPVAIIYSRSSWNPNPMPLFALISIYLVYHVWKNKRYNLLPWIGVSYAFVLQMHYLGLLLAPVIAFFLLLTYLPIRNITSSKKTLFRYCALGFLSFFLLMSPLLLFDLKHQGMNFNAFKSFFTDRQTTVNLNPARSDRFLPTILNSVTDLVTARQNVYPALISIFLLLSWIYFFFTSKTKEVFWVISVWLLIAYLGLGVYKQHVYVHYLGFIYPAIYILLGVIISNLINNKDRLLKFFGVAISLYLVILNIKFSPTWEKPNHQLKTTEKAVDFIISESKGQPFNFGLIAKQNYDESYRYFFENKNSKMVRGEVEVTDQLFVICEDGDLCQPEGNPAYQIAIFGPSSVVGSWQIDYLKIYKLQRK